MFGLGEVRGLEGAGLSTTGKGQSLPVQQKAGRWKYASQVFKSASNAPWTSPMWMHTALTTIFYLNHRQAPICSVHSVRWCGWFTGYYSELTWGAAPPSRVASCPSAPPAAHVPPRPPSAPTDPTSCPSLLLHYNPEGNLEFLYSTIYEIPLVHSSIKIYNTTYNKIYYWWALRYSRN